MTNAVRVVKKKSDVVLTVAHKDTLKIKVRPLMILRDKEVNVTRIALKLAKLADVSVVINNTITDINKKPDFFSFDKVNKAHFFGAVEKLNPRLVIDLHGCADVGPMFNNPMLHGYRFFRVRFRKERLISERPEVDIESRRGSGDATATAPIILNLAKYLALRGLVVDFEAIFPGGYVIKKLSNLNRQCVAIEIKRSVRENKAQEEKLIMGLFDFISAFRGKPPTEILDKSTFMDSEKIFKQFERMLSEAESSQKRRQLRLPYIT